ncbi:hypothetical protein EDC94DRAFT_696570 [Helicostylum pulchrum]|nr:hypothetical protein EDC94DRAFT_696570 [Helicostylum pulchrum]
MRKVLRRSIVCFKKHIYLLFILIILVLEVKHKTQNLKNSLFECLSSYSVSGDTYEDNDMQLSSLEMSIARDIYNANFKTMWGKKKLFNSTLNHLIDVLLRVHLAPERKSKYREMKAEKKIASERKLQKGTEKSFTRNRMRNLVREEYKKLKKYQVKSNERKAEASQKRIAFFKEIYAIKKSQPSDTANVQETKEDFVEDEMNNDKPKPETGNTEELLKDCCSEISKEELKVAALIVNHLAPYIPSKGLSFDIVQLPFILLANEIFEITSYQKFARNICPMPSLSLNTLRIDGPALHHMLSRKRVNSLYLFDYVGYIIDSEESARRHQDEVFASVFDMKSIQEKCQSAGLCLSRSITFVPGEKHTVKNSPQRKEKSSYLQALNDTEVVQELNNDEAVIKEEIGLLQKEAIIDYSKQKKDLKLQWRYSSDILQRNDIFTKIQHATACQKDGSKALYDLSNYNDVVIKAENAYVNRETVTDDNTLFSGTDNGVVTMTNTVGITLNRFKFHLELYNRYDALLDINESHSMEDIIEKYNTKGDGNSNFLKLSVCKKITAADIDVGTGHRKARRKLERKKKTTEDGKRILQIEKSLSETPLNSNLDIHEAHRNYFRFKGRKKSKLIMMIGDRGTEVGSRIKGHLRYGGKWKQDIHGKYTSVSIQSMPERLKEHMSELEVKDPLDALILGAFPDIQKVHHVS